MKLLSVFLARKQPVDFSVVLVHFPISGTRLVTQFSPCRDATIAQTLTAAETDLDLGLVKPTTMFGCVVHGEAFPKQTADLFSEPVCQSLASMRIQIVHHQMDGIDVLVSGNDLHQIICELSRRAVGRSFGKVSTGFRFNSAEDVSRAAAFVLAIAPMSAPHVLCCSVP